MQEPVFVLVRPQMGENIGAAARAMLNFGLSTMRLVDPRDGWPNQRAVAMASGAAGRVLDNAVMHPTTAEAVADCTHVYATTARSRDLTKRILTPEAAMAEAKGRIANGEKVAVLFGPERAGLENDDIALANTIVSVPVNPEFASLNLGQCVLLTAYEWRRHAVEAEPARMEFAGTEAATAIEVQKLGDHYEERLDEVGFFFPETKAAGMKRTLRNMWGRLDLTRADVQLLHGVLRQILRRRDALERDEGQQ
ncbi:RNA methyltransferase [Psychromarinibacter sp. S121]|uniref:RNA methyltransferase n=1 Tax=Psychromarinibacter sp. S121 TaxID=3415127 RepID=UPI003C7C0F7E